MFLSRAADIFYTFKGLFSVLSGSTLKDAFFGFYYFFHPSFETLTIVRLLLNGAFRQRSAKVRYRYSTRILIVVRNGQSDDKMNVKYLFHMVLCLHGSVDKVAVHSHRPEISPHNSSRLRL